MEKITLTTNARKVLEKRYLKRDEKGNIVETPEQMFERVAHNVSLADAKYRYKAKIKEWMKDSQSQYCDLTKTKKFQTLIKFDDDIKETEEKFYNAMVNLDFLPNSPTLFNAGLKFQQLAACFVLPVEDDMDSIFNAVHMTAIIHQSGGGTGFDFSHLRPRNDYVKATGGAASGPVSFMQIFDAATEQIKQGGKRQGANMGILRCDHPDIEEFITCKAERGVLKNFNVSVAVTDKFMRAVKNDQKFKLINPRNVRAAAEVTAKKLFHLLAKYAHQHADPGVVFIDTINKKNPTPHIGRIASTNPCGELPLLPFEACNLASINLSHMVKENDVDWDKLKETIHLGVHFLDNVIDMSRYPLEEIRNIVDRNRKIGLGIMGFAELLFQLNIPYNSEEALKFVEKLMKFLNSEAKEASVKLAKQRGVFPNFKGSVYDNEKPEDRVRHATRTTISPTGTISLIAGTSSGIEPIFALAFTKTVMDKTNLLEVNKHLKKIAKEKDFYSQEFMKELAQSGTLKGIKGIPQEIKKVFVTATEISPDDHIKMQAAFQKHVDNGVSKTVNLPENASVKDVENVFMLAYELGCKGTTVYRYGSREDQVLTFGTKKKK